VHQTTLAGLLAFAALAVCAGVTLAEGKDEKKAAPVLSFTMDSLSGKPVDLAQYQGKVVLIVNVASKCGFTPQYKGLEALYEKYGKDGFVILGFPANNFGHQEPGTNEEISEFCSKNYGVTFPMFAKVSVKGADQCPLYHFLTSAETDPKFKGPIRWNFDKFLINRKGEIVNRFQPQAPPDSGAVTQAIEAELAK
jgi:glutathione peroxidase